MNNREFTKVIDCLPEGFTWGQALTPDIALHIVNAALASQAQQTESRWISVEEAKATLKDGDLIYVAFQNGDVSEAAYRREQGYYPHRITSGKYGNERLEICTHVMRRKPTPLPPPPEGGDK